MRCREWDRSYTYGGGGVGMTDGTEVNSSEATVRALYRLAIG